jgi:phosphoserine/homoserine phosphotransferase
LRIVCADLEGILTPEIWIAMAERTGIEGLRATTRDVPDYDELMRQRLAILDDNGLGLPDIRAVVDTMKPLHGARDFVDWVRRRHPLVVLSDTYYEFVEPLMEMLGWPTLFCNRLKVAADGHIEDYVLRLRDHKRLTVESMQGLGFEAVAIGDSYNDIAMLQQADSGILFRPPETVRAEFPQFPVVAEYRDLKPLVAPDACGAGLAM